MEKYLPNFKKCIQKEPPFCTAECPFHLDIIDFIEKIKAARFNAAYKLYKNAVGFPGIAASLCHAPCKNVCPITNNPIELNLLEHAVIENAAIKEPTDYNLPKRKQKIAIIGAGISGMSCALRLSTKRYDVLVLEKSDRIGGELWDIIDPDIFRKEFDLQFRHVSCKINLQTEIISLEELKDFDAVYVATGKNGSDFGLLEKHLDKPCFMQGETGIFAGGSILGKEKIYAQADGLKMATTIDNFLKTGNLIYTPDPKGTNTILDEERLIITSAVTPANNSSYTGEEAIREADRCLKCQCDACRLYCDLTEYEKKWPLRIRDEIQATTLPGFSEVKATPAKRLISACTQCGLCVETCPKDIDIGGLILEARKSMHRQDKLAWVFNEFWLRDMEFTNGPMAGLVKGPPGKKGPFKFAFFPGCQLGAGEPDLVIKSYQYLLDLESSTGLILGCCGIPAEWAGNDDNLNEEISRINTAWLALGKPTFVLACPTCANHLKKHLPDIPSVFLYEIMDKEGISLSPNSLPIKKGPGTYSVFDPCSTRGNRALRGSVRSLAEKAGYELKPLVHQEKYSSCCSYGGQGSIADPGFAAFVRKKRITESEDPYICYCINCRDSFVEEGKSAFHILDLLFGNSPSSSTVTKRRENRIFLKEKMLKDFWGEKMEEMKKSYSFRLSVNDDLKKKLSKDRILEEDVMEVLEFCQRTGRTVYNKNTGVFSGYNMVGHMTLWIEYLKENDENFELINAYTHRMEIELEDVWNGEKIKHEK